MEQAVGLYRTAASCFGSVGEHRGGRLVLSLFFKAVLGIQRIFHFDSLNDEGLALLTGGRRTLSRSMLMVTRDRVIPIIPRPEFQISTVVVASGRQCSGAGQDR
jgi:hypothetical protein